MMHSPEVRCTLLDHHVLEYVASLPFSCNLCGNTTPWILREVARDLLPPSILARGKQGFGVSLKSWFGEDFGQLAREVLFNLRAGARGRLDPREVTRVVEAPDAPAWSVRSTAAA